MAKRSLEDATIDALIALSPIQNTTIDDNNYKYDRRNLDDYFINHNTVARINGKNKHIEYFVTPDGKVTQQLVDNDIDENYNQQLADVKRNAIRKYLGVNSVTPNRGNQLDKADARKVKIAKVDERVNKQFGVKSWGEFALSQAIGAAIAGSGAIFSSIPGISQATLKALETYSAYEGIKNLISKNGIRKTLKLIRNKDFNGSSYSLAGDLLDASMLIMGKNVYNYITKLSNNALEYGKDGFRYIDSMGIPKKELLTDTPNSMRRFIGSGTTGYKDALETGIIRGNPKPSLTGSTSETKKLGNYLKNKRCRTSDIRKLMSQNLDKESFDRLKPFIQKYGERYNGGIVDPIEKRAYTIYDANTYDEYKAIQAKAQKAHDIEIYLRNQSRIDGQTWMKNWGHNPQATFALHGEKLPNDLLFPGDYGVKIINANKYAQDATILGHFSEHPTTKIPLSIENPDVNFYVRKDGIFGKKYMRLIPKEKVLEDANRIKEGLEPTIKPRYNRLFNR